jgi:hypothetical protein
VKTLEEFEFKFQPSIDQRLVRELATGRFISSAENVLIFGPAQLTGRTEELTEQRKALYEILALIGAWQFQPFRINNLELVDQNSVGTGTTNGSDGLRRSKKLHRVRAERVSTPHVAR